MKIIVAVIERRKTMMWRVRIACFQISIYSYAKIFSMKCHFSSYWLLAIVQILTPFDTKASPFSKSRLFVALSACKVCETLFLPGDAFLAECGIIGRDLAFREVLADGLGYAVGTIEDDVLRMTPIVSKIRSNSDVFRIKSSHQDKNGYHHGAITISDPTGIVGSEVPIEATHLNGVEEVLIGGGENTVRQDWGRSVRHRC